MKTSLMGWVRLGCALAVSLAMLSPAWAEGESERLAQAAQLRRQGSLVESIDVLSQLERTAAPEWRFAILTQLGETLAQAGRLDEAQKHLTLAHGNSSDAQHSHAALLLARVQQQRRQPDEARRLYSEVLAAPGVSPDLAWPSRLNLARLTPQALRLAELRQLSSRMLAEGSAVAPAYHLNLGVQAAALGSAAVQLSHQHLELARQLADAQGQLRVWVEAQDALAQLYEDQQRGREALTLTRSALARVPAEQTSSLADLVIALQWRQARLLQAAGQSSRALAAYGRAVAQIEAVRQDIPIEYDDGRSSYRSTLEPVFQGYLDLLLQSAGMASTKQQSLVLQQAVEAIESIHQAELQDFLGDRCSVEAVQGGSFELAAGTAILYPVTLPNRTELLLRTSAGVTRSVSAVTAKDMRVAIDILAEGLRYGIDSYKEPSQQLYQWLMRPLVAELEAQQVRNLVVVPDGALRLVPFAVLNDGKSFLVERFAVSTVTGMSMTNTGAPRTRDVSALMAGVAEPGPVIDKLDDAMASLILQPEVQGAATRGLAFAGNTRAVRSDRVRALIKTGLEGPADGKSQRTAELRTQMSLPGVQEEVNALGKMLQGKVLLDGDFTAQQFRTQAESGSYRIVHVASHGIFGGSAETSFLLAYDELLTVTNLQNLLQAEQVQKSPIELLSLSACETAEGNDRAPLGISGAAMRARAKSVLGTLWPVNDQAAKTMMVKTYEGIAVDHLSKTEALQRAQVALLRTADFAHPFYWAPFVLIGNWQ